MFTFSMTILCILPVSKHFTIGAAYTRAALLEGSQILSLQTRIVLFLQLFNKLLRYTLIFLKRKSQLCDFTVVQYCYCY